MYQNRIVDHGEVPASQLLANPFNYRIHSKLQQEHLENVLDKVGWVDDVIVNQETGHIVDGHLRVTLALRKGDETPVPVKFVQLDEAEEKLVLASFDWITGEAGVDKDMLADILEGLDFDDLPLLDDIAVDFALKEPLDYEKEWGGMPEYDNDDLSAYQRIVVNFPSEEKRIEFADLIGQSLTENTRSIWYPKAEKQHDMKYDVYNGQP